MITVIDIGIVLVAATSLLAFLLHRRRLARGRLEGGTALVVLGMTIIGALFLADLFARYGLSSVAFTGSPPVHDLTSAYGRLVILSGALCILGGLVVSSRRGIALLDRQRRADADHETLFEHAAFGMFRAAGDGRIVEANPALLLMLGYPTAGDLMAVEPTALFANPADHARLLTQAGGDKWVEAFECRWIRQNGVQIPVRLSGRSLSRGRDDRACYEIVVEDLSPQEETEAQLRQAQKMEVIGQLTGGIAHDFNNALTVIQANADSVAALIPAGQRELHVSLEELQASARRGTALVRRLLSFSRRGLLLFRAVDLEQLVEDLLVSLRRLLPADIDVHFASEDGLPPIHADPGAVEQILVNLATNARDAMPEGGALHIVANRARLDEAHRAARGWGEPGEYVCLIVRDTGVGMDAETVDKVFEPFFTTKPVGRGTGLGLAIIYGLVKQHRGFVDVESAVGAGTTFKVYFPPAGEGVTPGESPPTVEPRGGTETILMAEDEGPIRRAAKRVLERYGYKVILARDGEEALRLFRQQRDGIDLVISDVVMPKMGGPQLYKVVRRESSGIKFLFSSGYRAEDTQLDVEPEPSIPFLDKPWTVTELLVHVRKVLDADPPARRNRGESTSSDGAEPGT